MEEGIACHKTAEGHVMQCNESQNRQSALETRVHWIQGIITHIQEVAPELQGTEWKTAGLPATED